MLIPLITALALAAPPALIVAAAPCCSEPQVIVKTIDASKCCPDTKKATKCRPGCGSEPQVFVKTIVLGEDGAGGEPHIIYFDGDGNDDEGEVQVKTVIMSVDETSAPQGNAFCYTIGGPAWCSAAGDKEKEFVVTACAPVSKQKVYIGVRITPIPEPLAAHIGTSGVMVANVFEGSPAEKAGLERYDVIVGFDGQAVDSPEDLTAAAAGSEAGQMAKVTVLRGGRKQQFDITPSSAPITIDLRMMYDEPEETLIKDYVNMRGLTLRTGPDGNWVMEDLGDLHDMSGMLDKLSTLNIDLQLDDYDQLLGKLGKIDGKLGKIGVCVQPGVSSSSSRSYSTEAQVTVQINEDGKVTTITSSPDGKIHVTTVDADGQESEATYDSPDEFEKADPKNFKCYSHTGTDVGPRTLWVQPGAARARKLRNEYQIDIETKIREAIEQDQKSQQQAKEQYQSARDEARRVIKHHSTHLGGVHASAEPDKLMIFTGDDGSLKVVVTKDGGKISYEFDSRAAFQAAEPELYERVKDDLD